MLSHQHWSAGKWSCHLSQAMEIFQCTGRSLSNIQKEAPSPQCEGQWGYKTRGHRELPLKPPPTWALPTINSLTPTYTQWAHPLSLLKDTVSPRLTRHTLFSLASGYTIQIPSQEFSLQPIALGNLPPHGLDATTSLSLSPSLYCLIIIYWLISTLSPD